jgi:hypothetical protein
MMEAFLVVLVVGVLFGGNLLVKHSSLQGRSKAVLLAAASVCLLAFAWIPDSSAGRGPRFVLTAFAISGLISAARAYRLPAAVHTSDDPKR